MRLPAHTRVFSWDLVELPYMIFRQERFRHRGDPGRFYRDQLFWDAVRMCRAMLYKRRLSHIRVRELCFGCGNTRLVDIDDGWGCVYVQGKDTRLALCKDCLPKVQAYMNENKISELFALDDFDAALGEQSHLTRQVGYWNTISAAIARYVQFRQPQSRSIPTF